MTPAHQEDSGGVGRTSVRSQFKGWRNRNRQMQQLLSVATNSNMADDNSMAADNHNPPRMNVVAAVAENTHCGNGSTAVPQSSQEKSIVQPLMGVFEDLIKSSTPQVPPLVGKRGSGSDTMDSRQMRSKKSRYDSDSSTGAKRRKGKTSTDDQRWSKRFTWPDEVRKFQ